MKKIVLFWMIILSVLSIYGQEKESWIKKHIDIGGYLNYSNMLMFHDAQDLTSNNLWHNRLNLTVYLTDNTTFKAGLRNRLYYGDWLQMPFFKEQLKKDNGILNLTTTFIDQPKLFEVSNLDRLSLDMVAGKTEIIIGRQRINWGMNTVWNPTDIFNTSNFLDMDYEEKPGTDALRLLYDINGMSSVEFAFTSSKDFVRDNDKWAFKYATSKEANDYQLQVGKYLNYFYTGIGWAGNFKNIGLKSEASYFYQKNKAYFIGSIEADYAFKNGINWTLATLYNDAYSNNFLTAGAFTGQSLDVFHLFPAQWALFNQFSGNFGPAWTWSAGILYGNQNHLTILIPAINYTIKDNWEVNVFMQSYFADIPGMKQTNLLNFRLLYHF